MPFKKTIFTLLFVLSFSGLVAQMGWAKGELFLKSGETKTGFIKLNIASKSIVSLSPTKNVTKFKPTKRGKKITYTPAEVDHIVIDDRVFGGYYEYIAISPKKKALFSIIIRGDVVLYRRHVKTSTIGPGGKPRSPFGVEYFVKREREAIATPLLTDAIARKFQKKASIYFSDCTAVVVKIEDGTYTRGSIKKVVREYNSCAVAK